MAYNDPYSDFDQLFDEMRRSAFGGLPSWPGAYGAPLLGAGPSGIPQGPRVPMVDLVDEGDRYTLTAELPGVRKEDIRLNIRGNVVRLHAERSEEWTEGAPQTGVGERAERALKGGARGAGRAGGTAAQPTTSSYVRRERSQMSFDRVIRLPEDVRSDQAMARLTNGILSVTIPKAEAEEGGRGIQIE